MHNTLIYHLPKEAWHTEAFTPHTLAVTYRPDGEDQRADFVFEETPIEPRWPAEGTMVCLIIYNDAWGVIQNLPELFAQLAADKPSTLAEIARILDRHGAIDTTPRENPGRHGPALNAAREFQRKPTPGTATTAAKELLAYAADPEDPTPF